MTDEKRVVHDALAGLVAEPYLPGWLADRVAESYGRRRRRRGAATLAAAVSVGAIVAVPALARSPRPAEPVASTSPTPAAVPDGPRLEGTVTVLAAPDHPVRLCPPAVQLLGDWDALHAPPPCDDGIPAAAVDLAGLANREERDGSVWGVAWVMGVYADGTFTVVEQGAPRQRPGGMDEWRTSVPCPEPPGGWENIGGKYPDLAALARYSKAHPGAIVHERYAHPAPRRMVLVVAAIGAERVTEALRPEYGDRLCVVESTYSKEQVAATRQAVSELLRSGPGFRSGGGYTGSADGQVKINLEANLPTPEIDAFLATQPEGLVQVDYWLAPVVAG